MGISLSVSLYAPNGQKLIVLNIPRDGPTPISVVSNASGVYRLEVQCLDTETAAGSYELHIEELRQAKLEDTKRISAERLGSEADLLSFDGSKQSAKQAVALHKRALSVWIALGDKSQQARTLKSICDILQPMGEAASALNYYNLALRLARAVNDRTTEGEILSSLGYLLIHLGKNREALDTCLKALSVSRTVKNKRGEAEALANIGEVYSYIGEVRNAVDYLQKAQSLWTELGDRRGQALTLLYFGYAYSDLDESRKSFEAYGQALSIWRSIGDRRGQALTLTGVGNLHSRLGSKQEALMVYDQARQLLQGISAPVAEARLLTGMAFVYRELGDLERALDCHRRASILFLSAGYKPGETACLVSIGGIYYTMTRYTEALAALTRALSLSRALNERIVESYACKNLAAVYDALGNQNLARQYYDKALALYRASGDRRGEALALNGLANIENANGEKQRALDAHIRALKLNREVSDRFGEITTLFYIARIERDSGQLADARAHIDEATNKIELLRAGVTSQELRASFVAAIRQSYELNVDLLMRLHAQNPTNELAAAALYTVERGRARSLIEMLSETRADIRHGVDEELLKRERLLLLSLNEKEDFYSKLTAGKHTAQQSAEALREIESVRADYKQVQALIRSMSPRYAALTQPQPLSLREIQEQVLDSNTVLLEYALGDERSYLWMVTSNSVASFELPMRADIEAAARRVYELLTRDQRTVKGETVLQSGKRTAQADGDYATAVTALSRMVIGPVASQLGTKRLLIVADGALQYIPFGALPVPMANNITGGLHAVDIQKDVKWLAATLEPLIVEHEIVNLPSASTLAVMRRELAGRKPAPKSIAVLADPVFSRLDPRVGSVSLQAASSRGNEVSRSRDFERAIKEVRVSRQRGGVSRLPFSRREAAAIKSAVGEGQTLEAVDFDASRATAMSAELGQYRIIHFATHGLLNSEHPELSGLVFSLVDRQGKPQNGFLRLHEVYNLNLPAELVVLSACQTGLGKDVKGEGLVGLTRGFMYAGAARVMASLWQVDDLATAELMKRFYAKVLGEGLRPAAALRDAQVEMWKQKQWHAPYYWAGFTLQGEWK
jgi:CHAT domain-containing protein/tetratricopeptide (TPR) repeat protein